MLRQCFSLLLSGLLLAASTNILAENASSDEMHFLTLSDIHFDPFQACHQKRPCPLIEKLRRAPASEWPSILAVYDKDAPQFRQDTGYPLLRAALAAAKKDALAKHAQFVLVLGDFLGHEYRSYYISYTLDRSRAGYREFVKKTMAFLTDELARTFPDVSVYPVVGNNDTYHSDYVTQPNGAFFQDTASLWSVLIKDKSARAAFVKVFPKGGYYAVDLPAPARLRIIVLNSVLFSEKSRGKDEAVAAVDELNWLQAQLEQAKINNQKVFIAMHIPASIDIYASLHYRLFRMIELWKREYTERFESELKDYAPEIAGIFSGHLHTDWFQMLTLSNANTVPVTGTPSISPIFSNNPGYKIYTYSPATGQIEDFETHYYAIDQKQAVSRVNYNFARLYHANCRNFPIQTTASLPDTVSHLAQFYHKFFFTPDAAQGQIAGVWHPYYWCSTTLI